MVVEPMPQQQSNAAPYFYIADTENHRIARGIFSGVGPGNP
jgi:hypothetical protein